MADDSIPTKTGPRCVYVVRMGTLMTTTPRSFLKVEYGREDGMPKLHPTLRSARRAAEVEAESDIDVDDLGHEDVHVLYVIGKLDGKRSVEFYEIEEIELEPEHGPEDGDA
jgi:hypothetical protein